MSGTLGAPWLTCRGLLYKLTRRPPVYGHFCAILYHQVSEICGDGMAYGMGANIPRSNVRLSPYTVRSEPYMESPLFPFWVHFL
jgi:hypothetical protein